MSLEHLNNLCMGCFSPLQAGNPVCTVCGYDQSPEPERPYRLPTRTILSGKYMVGRVLGEGGFGITYVGYDLNLEIKVAVKEYYPSGFVTRATTVSTTVQPYDGELGDVFLKGRDRFVDEAKRLARFRVFAGIVMVNDFFVENGTAYIVMEYVEGRTLKEYLTERGGKLPPEQIFEMLRPVFSSLAQVHESGIIHRDISPDNLMITRDGSVKLLDFGAAREFGEDGNKSLSVMLKHGYAPAEQYSTKGMQGPFTDVYALSATIYKAITGITPESSMDRMLDDTVKPPCKLGIMLPDHQEAALMKGLAIRQQDRFQTISELYEALLLQSGTQGSIQQDSKDGHPKSATVSVPLAPPVQGDGSAMHRDDKDVPQSRDYLSRSVAPVPVSVPPATKPPEKKKGPVESNKNKIIGVIAAACVFIAIIIAISLPSGAPDGRNSNTSPDRAPESEIAETTGETPTSSPQAPPPKPTPEAPPAEPVPLPEIQPEAPVEEVLSVYDQVLRSLEAADITLAFLRNYTSPSEYESLGFSTDRQELRKAQNRGLDVDWVLTAIWNSDERPDFDCTVLIMFGADNTRRVQVRYPLDVLSPDEISDVFLHASYLNSINPRYASEDNRYFAYRNRDGESVYSKGDMLDAIKNDTRFQLISMRRIDDRDYSIASVLLMRDEGELYLVLQNNDLLS